MVVSWSSVYVLFFFFLNKLVLSWSCHDKSGTGHLLVCVRCGVCQVCHPTVRSVCQGQAAWFWVPHWQPADGAASRGKHAAHCRGCPELWWVSSDCLVLFKFILLGSVVGCSSNLWSCTWYWMDLRFCELWRGLAGWIEELNQTIGWHNCTVFCFVFCSGFSAGRDDVSDLRQRVSLLVSLF